MTVYKACCVCGRRYVPVSPHERGCDRHSGRKSRSPTTRAQTTEYERARKAILATHPQCIYCGRAADTIDHIVAIANGGDTSAENLQPCCASCNYSKRDRDDWQPPSRQTTPNPTPPNGTPQRGSGRVTDHAPHRPLIA